MALLLNSRITEYLRQNDSTVRALITSADTDNAALKQRYLHIGVGGMTFNEIYGATVVLDSDLSYGNIELRGDVRKTYR